ncbi:zeta toxin family protein [Actinophytocola sediminis]
MASAAVLGGLTAAPSAAEPALDPLTDEQWAAHVERVDEAVIEAVAEGLATDRTHTVNGDGVTWLPERAAQQRRIASELYARGELVPNGGEAVFTGGLPGVSRTAVLNQSPSIDPSRYLVLDANDAKQKMCEYGIIPEIDGIAPLETADLIQRESSHIIGLVAELAAADRKNVIWNTTMGSNGALDSRLAALRDAGYEQYTAVFLDVPIEASLERTDQRHRDGFEEFRNGDVCAGRHVPARVIEAQADTEYESVNRRVFELHKSDFDRWYVYDATDLPAVLVDQG